MDSKNNQKKFLNRWENILGMISSKDVKLNNDATKKPPTAQFKVPSIFSQSELERLPGFAKNGSNSPANEANILTTYLRQISLNIASNEEKIRNYIAINPEIKKAQQIYVSSVMSPNDLQSENIQFNLSGEELEPALRDEIVTYLDDFFNKEYKFGSKLAGWIGEYTYTTDAKVIMILPKSNLNDLTKFHEAIESGKGLELYTEEEHIGEQVPDIPNVKNSDDFNLIIGAEAYSLYKASIDPTGKLTKQLITEMAGATVKEIKAGYFNFTTDIVKVSQMKQAHDRIHAKKTESLVNRMYNAFQGAGTNILAISDKASDDNLQPIAMEIPAKAVIPIIVPGSKAEHIGYFILMDEWGNPLSVLDSHFTFMNDDEKLAKLSALSMFATPTAVMGNNLINNPDQRLQLTQSIFGIAMKSLLKDKFQENRLIDIPVHEYEALSKFLFHQLLNRNRTTILFVPADLVVYYCDSYRDDGTGQSKVSGIDFALSLRTTLLVAGVMGAIRSSVDKEVYEVTVDEKNTNFMQTVNMVKDNAIAKKAYDFTVTNPLAISRSIAESAVTVYPKGIKGSQFEINKSSDSGGSDYRRPDEQLMQTVDNMVIDNLGVPPSSLNRLNEDEYARSVTTVNILFSNEIRKTQQYVCATSKKFIVNYLRFSKNNQKALVDIFRKFNGNNPAKVDEELKNNDDDATLAVDEKQPTGDFTAEEIKFLREVLTNIELFLPPPNIAVTKSHLENLEQEINFIDQISGAIYNEELIAAESDEAKAFMRATAVYVKAKLCREIMDKSTLHQSFDFPHLEDIDVDELARYYKAALNKKKALVNLHDSISQNLEAGKDIEETAMM